MFTKSVASHDRRQYVYNSSWGSTDMARLEGPKWEARRAERGRVLGKGMFPSPPARGLGEHCKLSQYGPGQMSRQPNDLERFIGLQSRSWCRLC